MTHPLAREGGCFRQMAQSFGTPGLCGLIGLGKALLGPACVVLGCTREAGCYEDSRDAGKLEIGFKSPFAHRREILP